MATKRIAVGDLNSGDIAVIGGIRYKACIRLRDAWGFRYVEEDHGRYDWFVDTVVPESVERYTPKPMRDIDVGKGFDPLAAK